MYKHGKNEKYAKLYVRSKIEKVPRDIRGEKSGKSRQVWGKFS